MRIAHRRVPWSLDDLRRLMKVLALSITGLVVAWLFAGGTTDPAHQEYAIAGAIVATTLGVAGLTGWLLAGIRSLRAERARALAEIRGLISRRSVGTDPRTLPAAGDGPVTAQGMSHFHDAACLMVREKEVHAMQTAEFDHLVPCPICSIKDAS